MHVYLIICCVQLLCKSWQRIIIEEKNKKKEIKIHKSTNHAYIYGWEGIILLYNREYYRASLYPYPNEPSRSVSLVLPHIFMYLHVLFIFYIKLLEIFFTYIYKCQIKFLFLFFIFSYIYKVSILSIHFFCINCTRHV